MKFQSFILLQASKKLFVRMPDALMAAAKMHNRISCKATIKAKQKPLYLKKKFILPRFFVYKNIPRFYLQGEQLNEEKSTNCSNFVQTI
jgi:hypothetical protein